MPDIEAFEPITIERKPSTTFYKGSTYRSDRTYIDAAGVRWVYVGICDGDPLWSRENETTAWIINTVVDQFGPLTEAVNPVADQLADDKTHALIAAAIGEAKPARDGVLASLAQSVKDRAEHDHSTTADWDWYCLNLSGYMGDRMGPVLRRLLDAETERDRLRVMYDVVSERENDLIEERDALRARVAELEAAAEEIRHLHKDSPMGPCPVCIDGDALARGDDYTVPYPCPTARAAGATDCNPRGATA